jgi:hypothetical protein
MADGAAGGGALAEALCAPGFTARLAASVAPLRPVAACDALRQPLIAVEEEDDGDVTVSARAGGAAPEARHAPQLAAARPLLA